MKEVYNVIGISLPLTGVFAIHILMLVPIYEYVSGLMNDSLIQGYFIPTHQAIAQYLYMIMKRLDLKKETMLCNGEWW